MQVGDPCHIGECDGTLEVYSTHVSENTQRRTQYLRCKKCKARPVDNKIVIPLKYAPRRHRIATHSNDPSRV